MEGRSGGGGGGYYASTYTLSSLVSRIYSESSFALCSPGPVIMSGLCALLSFSYICMYFFSDSLLSLFSLFEQVVSSSLVSHMHAAGIVLVSPVLCQLLHSLIPLSYAHYAFMQLFSTCTSYTEKNWLEKQATRFFTHFRNLFGPRLADRKILHTPDNEWVEILFLAQIHLAGFGNETKIVISKPSKELCL